MSLAIDVSNVSKSFRRYRPERPMMLQEVLARGFRGLGKTDRFWAVHDVSFSVPRGRAVGIIGTNGSGKSTLLRLVGGIGSADSGRIHVAGRIGALLDLGSGLHGDLTGRENIIVAGVLNGLSRQEVLRRFDDIVAFAEIEKSIDNPMRTYSSGMQMRLAFATNVHTNPDVLLIDEVLAVGDAAFQRKCLARIKEFKANGCSILLVSHGLATVQKLCDEVLWMNYGRVMAHGPVRDVVRQYEAHVGHSMEVDAGGGPREGVSVTVPEGTATAHSAAEGGLRAGPVRVVAVDLLDGTGHPLTNFRAGDPLRVAIGFESDADSLPRFRVRLLREDGLVCCHFVTDGTDLPRSPWAGGGCITLAVDRIDLNPGRYAVDVSVFLEVEPPSGDALAPGASLVVIGANAREAVLNPPHHWELDVRDREVATRD